MIVVLPKDNNNMSRQLLSSKRNKFNPSPHESINIGDDIDNEANNFMSMTYSGISVFQCCMITGCLILLALAIAAVVIAKQNNDALDMPAAPSSLFNKLNDMKEIRDNLSLLENRINSVSNSIDGQIDHMDNDLTGQVSQLHDQITLLLSTMEELELNTDDTIHNNEDTLINLAKTINTLENHIINIEHNVNSITNDPSTPSSITPPSSLPPIFESSVISNKN